MTPSRAATVLKKGAGLCKKEREGRRRKRGVNYLSISATILENPQQAIYKKQRVEKKKRGKNGFTTSHRKDLILGGGNIGQCVGQATNKMKCHYVACRKIWYVRISAWCFHTDPTQCSGRKDGE